MLAMMALFANHRACGKVRAMSGFFNCDFRARRGYHHGNLREVLLAAARQLVAEKGPSGFTLVEAARLAGVSPAAPYRHFKDREALLDELADRGFQLFSERLAKAMRGAAAMEGFLQLGEAYLAFAREEPGLYAAMFSRSGGTPSAEPMEPGESDKEGDKSGGFNVLVEAMTRMAGPDGFGDLDPRFVALQVWCLAHGVATLSTAGRLPVGPGIPTAQAILAHGVGSLILGARLPRKAPVK